MSTTLVKDTRAHAWKLAQAAQLVVLLALETGLALWWRPEPHSDWLYYWMAAGQVDLYERGGLSLWLLAIPKALGFTPVVSALALNLLATISLWWLAYHADSGRWRIFAQMVIAYLLLITPFAGIVQLDLLAAAQLGTGFWLLLDRRIRLSRAWSVALAGTAIAMAVSTRPQYALTLWTMLAIAAVSWCLLRRSSEGVPLLLGTLLLGSVAGFALDMGMRSLSGRTEQIRTSSAVTLYGGLLVSSDRRNEGCGYWSVRAAEAAKADLGKPLVDAVRDRLAAQPPGHWWSVLRCKAPEILKPSPYALYWLIESPNVRERINASPEHERIDAQYHRALAWERRLYNALRALIVVMCFWTAVRLWRRGPVLALMPVLWLVSFWGVHAVFEIQGRYFLGMLVLAPLLCALLHLPRPIDRTAKDMVA